MHRYDTVRVGTMLMQPRASDLFHYVAHGLPKGSLRRMDADS